MSLWQSHSKEILYKSGEQPWPTGLIGRLKLATARKWTSMSRRGPRNADDILQSTGLIESGYNQNFAQKMVMENRLFKLSIDQTVNILQLTLPDGLDSMEVDRLIEDVMQSIAGKATGRWIVDLSEVQYMGSSMLGLMVNIRERIRQATGKVVLCGLSPQLMHIFHTCCLERLFVIAKTRDEGMKMALRK